MGRRCGAGVGQRPKVLGQSLLGKHTSARLKSKCWNTRLDVSILVGLTAKGQISLLLDDVRGGDTKTLGGLGWAWEAAVATTVAAATAIAAMWSHSHTHNKTLESADNHWDIQTHRWRRGFCSDWLKRSYKWLMVWKEGDKHTWRTTSCFHLSCLAWCHRTLLHSSNNHPCSSGSSRCSTPTHFISCYRGLCIRHTRHQVLR